MGLSISSDELYGEIWAEDPSALNVELGRSLAPRATVMLYDEFARLGVGPDDLVLDAGGRDAVHAIELVRRLDCRAISIDPVPLHVARARDCVAAGGSRTGSTSSMRRPSRFRLRMRRSVSCGAETS